MSKFKNTIVQSLLTMLEPDFASKNMDDKVACCKGKKLTLITTAGIFTGIPLSDGELPNQCILLKDVILHTPADKTFEYVFLYVFLDDVIAATICGDF